MGVFLMSMPGCGSGSALTLTSSSAEVQPDFQTAVYRFIDPNTADVFLSDFPREAIVERLAQGVDGPPGHLIHVHLFLSPKAGKTPIDFTASNCAITYAVFSGTSIGLYGGGGFVLPSSSVGDSTLSGRIRGATLGLMEAKPGFADRLGRSTLDGSISAQRDDALAQQISARLTRLILQ